ncbi:hypothetical protein [Aeromonas sobria]|uniref:hypothetical protein n=1 Tax=Aeromonas sobria TaxID=646 RepID=UPI00111BB231|nr:hypothetical protein [Aeromonas sobria]
MIYLDCRYTRELASQYTDACKAYLSGRITKIIHNAHDNYKNALTLFFTEHGIDTLIQGDPLSLKLAYEEIFDTLPIISERYNQKIFFDSLNFVFDKTDYNLRIKIDKARLLQLKDDVIIEIDRFVTNRNSLLLVEIRNQLIGTNEPKAIRDTLNKLMTIKSGKSVLSAEQINFFPKWVNDIEDVFNYSHLITNYGQLIVNSVDLSYCPYCAEEVIESFDNYRPAIDHFYPQSKYPFLALSLYNFVPAGTRCNSDFKKSNEMLGYYNPRMTPFTEEKMFQFIYPLDKTVTRDNTLVEVNPISDEIDLSIKLFKIESVYNKDSCKDLFSKFIFNYQYLESLGRDSFNKILSNNDAVKNLLGVDLTNSPKKVQHQKFLLDALNQISGIRYTVNNT